MTWNRVSVALIVVLALGNVAQCADNRGVYANQRATLKQLQDAEHRVTIWQARYAEASSTVRRDVDTVRVRVTRVDTLRQTLNIRDTLEVIRYVAATDTALRTCSELANSCALFRVTADSTNHSLTVERDAWRRMYEARNRRLEWQAKAMPVALVLGVAFGAWIRGNE